MWRFRIAIQYEKRNLMFLKGLIVWNYYRKFTIIYNMTEWPIASLYPRRWFALIIFLREWDTNRITCKECYTILKYTAAS